MSHSPSPARSRYSRRSPSPLDSKRKVRRDSRSPRRYKRSPSSRRSQSSSPSSYRKEKKGKSRSYKLSPGRRSRYSKSPESSRSRKERRRSSSSSQSSPRSHSPVSSKYRSQSDKRSPQQKSRKGKDPCEDVDQFRNRSPPSSARVEPQGSSWTMPGPSGYSSTSISAPIVPKINTMDKETQKVDLEELMMSLNFLVKTQHMSASSIKTPQDVKSSLEIMFVLTKSLYEVINLNFDDGLITSQENTVKHKHQKELLKKIMGHLKKFMFPAAGLA